MERQDRIALWAVVVGLAGTVLTMAGPPAFPRASAWVWVTCFYSACAVVVVGIFILAFDLFIRPRWAGKKLEPANLIIFGALGVWAFATLLVIGIIWRLAAPQVQTAELTALTSKLDAVQNDFARYAKPRELTAEQVQAIVDYLLPRDHQSLTIVYRPPDEEAHRYFTQLFQTFREAGWDVQTNQISAGTPYADFTVVQGLMIQARYGPAFKGGTPKKVDLIQNALSRAKVVYNGVGGSYGTPGLSNDEVQLILIVGPRPMRVDIALPLYPPLPASPSSAQQPAPPK